MSPRHVRISILRCGALIALGALAVHQLRYLLAYGGRSGAELIHQGHGYLLQALPILCGFAIALLAAGLLRAWGTASPGAAPLAARFQTRALLYAAAILAVFASQELIEGTFAAGHAAGFAAVFGSGGWLAVPLALLAGAAAAFTDRAVFAAERFVAAVADRQRGPLERPTRGSARRPAPDFVHLTSTPLAFGLARRPPPPLG
jgi:hypothetical protein